MNTLDLKIAGMRPGVAVYADGRRVRCKKNSFGSYGACIRTQSDEVRLVLAVRPELSCGLWWLYALFAYFVSVFGIFDPPYGKKDICMECVFRISVQGACQCGIALAPPAREGRAASVGTECAFIEERNEYFSDPAVRRRKTAILIVKILSWIALAVCAGLLIARGI